MTTRNHRKPKGLARPIKTKRDYDGAAAVAKRLSGQKSRDSAAEARLKSLLHEMEKYDEEADDDAGADFTSGDDYTGPRRRWSDDGSSET